MPDPPDRRGDVSRRYAAAPGETTEAIGRPRMRVELDHVFVMSPPGGGRVLEQLAALGLVETYRRTHRGQGTANACFAFDNAFLEVLWIDDAPTTRTPAVARCRFERRASDDADHPVGIAGRGSLPTDTWSFRPPYLPPASRGIDVAAESDVIGAPMLFTFPGTSAPEEWAPDRRGELQRAAGFERLHVEVLHTDVEPGAALGGLHRATVVERLAPGPPAVLLRFDGPDRCERVRLPSSDD